MSIEDIKQNAPDGATHYSETDMEYIFLKESYTISEAFKQNAKFHNKNEKGIRKT